MNEFSRLREDSANLYLKLLDIDLSIFQIPAANIGRYHRRIHFTHGR